MYLIYFDEVLDRKIDDLSSNKAYIIIKMKNYFFIEKYKITYIFSGYSRQAASPYKLFPRSLPGKEPENHNSIELCRSFLDLLPHLTEFPKTSA